MACVRCGRTEQIEQHHIIERCEGGGDAPVNKEERCEACHKFEHARRQIQTALEHERKRGQADRVRVYEHRLEVLGRLNTPRLIRERGAYLSYWTDHSTHYLPRRVATAKEAALDNQIEIMVAEGGHEE